jgi:hypothetical protein
MFAIDHVVIAVADLEAAAATLERDHGLASVAGGRHPGHGTGNRIVPLGDSYLELMAIVDDGEAAASPLGAWLRRRVAASGDGPVALCLRTDDIAVASQRTGHRALAMSRRRPDGVELSWHLVALEAALTDGLPFFIEWHMADREHPGRAHVGHRIAATGIAWVELGADADRLDAWLGGAVPEIRVVDGDPGVHRVAVSVAEGEPLVIE